MVSRAEKRTICDSLIFLEEQTAFDEGVIKEAFKDTSFVKNLHVTKNYLYHLILKSLRSFHAQSHIDQKIGDLIADIHLLEGRGLYQQARQSLLKAKKMASKYHRYYYLVFLLRKEATYHFAIDEKKMQENIERINVEIEYANQVLVEENKIFILYHQSVYLIRNRTPSKEISKDLKEKLLIYEKGASQNNFPSFYSGYLKESIHAAIAYEEGQLFNWYQSAREVIHLWKNNKQMIELEPHIYKIHLSNFLHAAF